MQTPEEVESTRLDWLVQLERHRRALHDTDKAEHRIRLMGEIVSIQEHVHRLGELRDELAAGR